jgi:ATP/maltotriose-dependent transcriptional regulator MalT
LLLDGLATRIAIGYVEAVPTLRDAVAALQIGNPIDSGGARWSDLGSFAAQELWDFDGRRAFLEQLCDVERKMGAADRLRFTLVALGDCEMWAGRFAAAESYQLQALDLSEAINGSTYLWDLMNVEVLAWRGRDADTRRRVEALIAVAEQSRAATVAGLARISLVVLELGSSRYEEAFTLARQVYDDDPLAFGNEVLPNLVEAAVRSGNVDSAEAACARLSERATASGTPWALGLLARSRALLATGDDAEAHYNEAIDRLTQTSVVTDLAHAHLLYGEWLGRRKRRSDARGQLRKALDMFDTMGALAYAERTRAELVRTGARVRDRSVETMYELTPQEEQVARLAAGGATNSEIAAQLFLSAATIDYHLRKVYKKLGVESRRDLVDVLPR